MIYKIETAKFGGAHYFRGFRFVSERGDPDYILEVDLFPPEADSLVDESGKLQWALEPNPDYNAEAGPSRENRPHIIVNRPQAMSIEEVATQTRAETVGIVAKNLDLVVRALIGVKTGDYTAIDELAKLIEGVPNATP